MEAELCGAASRLTTTQIGAVGEAIIAAGLILASDGRLAPFRPFADDDGTDLLLFDKTSKQAVPLQVKCRMKVDDIVAQTVQFDVRLKTFAKEGSGFVLAALLDGMAVRTAWLLPARELAAVARTASSKLVVVASAKPESQDRYRPYRHDNLVSVACMILAATGTSP